MVLIRINPTKILVGGDKKAAMTFAGPARSQLEILKQGMSFQNLSQGIRRVWLNENVYVECKKIFNYQECKIWVRPVTVLEEGEAKELYFYVRIVCTQNGDDEKKSYSDVLFYQEPQILGKHRDLSLTRTVDRLILWKCRGEVKGTSSFDAASYEEVGEYEDGSFWAVTKKGSVILDVDVVNRTVYSSSNGIDVDTSMSAEAQLTLADRYIEQINTKESLVRLQRNNYELHPDYRPLDPNDERSTEIEKPEDITSFFYMRGEVINPLQMATECDVFAFPADPSGYEVYFDDPFNINIDDTLWDYYHYMEPPRTYFPEQDIYRWYDGQCNNPPALFESLEWPKIIENREKYLPTQRIFGDYLEGPPGVPAHMISDFHLNCGPLMFSVPHSQNASYTGVTINNYLIASPYIYGDGYYSVGINENEVWYYRRVCDFKDERTDIDHIQGSYYTSRSTYPCFFTTLVGRKEPIKGLRWAGFWGTLPDQPDNAWRFGNAGVRPEGTHYLAGKPWFEHGFLSTGTAPSNTKNYDRLKWNIDPGHTGVSTPLEQYISLIEFTTESHAFDILPDWVHRLIAFMGGATGTFDSVGIAMDEHVIASFPTLAPIIQNELNVAYANGFTADSRDLGWDSFTRTTLNLTVPIETKHFADSFVMVRDGEAGGLKAALVVFHEINYSLTAYRSQYLLAETEEFQYKESFAIGIIFYIIYPAFDIKITGEETEYWDIHAEREYSQDEINHNRELDLETYVSGVLRDIKDSLPYAETGIPELLIAADYDITTGFTHPLH